MADVADGRVRAVSRAGASFHCAGERTGPCLWPEALHDRDAEALWRARPAAWGTGVCRRLPVGRGFCDPRLALAASAPQGRAVGFPQRETLVRDGDGTACRQARYGRE